MFDYNWRVWLLNIQIISTEVHAHVNETILFKNTCFYRNVRDHDHDTCKKLIICMKLE
jgi:hypothetical protein